MVSVGMTNVGSFEENKKKRNLFRQRTLLLEGL